jgi:tRNA nucleotidyltransferase (CCA-adding enzyme)
VTLTEVILTHSGADFDGLASMWCARHFYPHATPLLQGSPEGGVREFLETYRDEFAIDYARAVDQMPLTRVVLVDVQVPARLGEFRERVADPGIEVHVYDHHPPTQESIRGDVHVVETVGATTTLMVGRLMEMGAVAPSLTPLEATLYALGIYEETGSLLFPDTTAADVRAVAWLLERGARLDIVATFTQHPLDAEQRKLLNDLLGSLTTRLEKGMTILLATAECEEYVGDVAVVAHRLMDIERADALFCIVRMGDRILVVGRSRDSGPDVGTLLAHLGGGGHPRAASATLHDSSVEAVRQELGVLLERHAMPPQRAGDIMSAPVASIDAALTMREAHDWFVRLGYSTLPVIRDGMLVGMLRRRDVDKALQHDMRDAPIEGYWSTPQITALTDTSTMELQRALISGGVDRVPIIDHGRLVGIVTRSDLLEAMGTPAPLHQDETLARLAALPTAVQILLRQAGAVAGETGAYAVGGFVRDVLLGVENLDLDLVVEGDGIAFAERLADQLGGRVREHRKFGTAVIILADGMHLDVASTRIEFYTRPAALPDVLGSTLKQDLFRRDFTINAMAIALNAARYGQLHDYFGASRDLRDGVIRVLHNLSFIDDPTRIFRAIKFEARYHFRMEPHTERLARQALREKRLEQLSTPRVREEFVQILGEARPLRAILRMHELGVLRSIHPHLQVTPRIRMLLEDVTATLAQYGELVRREKLQTWIIHMRALFSGSPAALLEEVADRYRLANEPRRRVFLSRSQVQFLLRRLYRTKLLPSEIHELLSPLSLEMVLYVLARSKSRAIKENIVLYLERLRLMHPLVSGHHLRAWGIEPGPEMGNLLARLFAAQLDGKFKTRPEARAWLEEKDIIAAWT